MPTRGPRHRDRAPFLGRAHRRLWLALQARSRSVEIVAAVRTRREVARARKLLGHWAEAPTGPDRARRELERIEVAIRGMDDAEVERLGGFRSCLVRIAELRKLLRCASPASAIDGSRRGDPAGFAQFVVVVPDHHLRLGTS